jgi:hypothetical protein
MQATNGKATKSKSTFRMECAVAININAKPEKIWGLLTNAQDFPRWNSMVERIEGRIAVGETIKLKVPYAPGREFKLKVSTMTAPRLMVWQDGMAPMFTGVRTYTLTPKNDGSTDFSMVEVFSGLMMLMIGGSLPDLTQSFERYAADLKKEAEKS